MKTSRIPQVLSGIAAAVLFAMGCPLTANAQSDTTVTVINLDAESEATSQATRVDSLQEQLNAVNQKLEQNTLSARQDKVWKRRRYFYLSYITSQTLTFKDLNNEKAKLDVGFALNMGRTFYLHKKPIANMIKFGIDWTYFDISYAKYKDTEISYSSSETYKAPARPAALTRYLPEIGGDGYYEDYDDFGFDLGQNFGNKQVDIAMGVGPSVTVNPIDYLKAAVYFHYMPTGSLMLHDSDVNAAFVNGWSFGLTASWKLISLGFETRWAEGKYSRFDTDDLSDDSFDEDGGFSLSTDKQKLRTKSFRIFIGLRF